MTYCLSCQKVTCKPWPLSTLVQEADAIRSFDFNFPLSRRSPVLEVDQLSVSMARMKDTLASFFRITDTLGAETHFAPLLQRETLDIRLQLDEESEVQAPLSLLAIALGNLLKNALSYAEGHIEITLHEQVLTISNPTAAAPDQILGYGCGLTIIQRICEKLGWQIETRLEGGIFSA